MEFANYFKCEPRFNGVFSGNNLLRVKDGAYVVNRDDKNSKGNLLIEIQLYTLILLELNIFLKKY